MTHSTLLPAALFVMEFWELGSQPTCLGWIDTPFDTAGNAVQGRASVWEKFHFQFSIGWRSGREVLLPTNSKG